MIHGPHGARRREEIGVVEEKLAEKEEVVDEADQRAKEHRADAGDDRRRTTAISDSHTRPICRGGPIFMERASPAPRIGRAPAGVPSMAPATLACVRSHACCGNHTHR